MPRKLDGTFIESGTITITQLSGSVNETSNAAYGQANLAYDQANTARSQANAAYGQANIARSDANTTFATVNTSFGTLNTTFGTVNTSLGTVNTAVTNAHNQANAAFNAANGKLSLTGGTIVGDISVTGNLFVNGTETIVNTSSLTINDPIFLLANNNTTNAVGLGFVAHYGPTQQHTGLIRAHQDNNWYLFENYDSHILYANNVLDVANVKLATLRANVNANSLLLLGNTVATQANLTLAHNQANSARSDANTTFGTINTTFATLNTSAGTQNTNFGTINTTFNTINTTFGTVNTNITNTFTVSFTANINASTDRTPGSYGSYASSATNTPTNSGILLNLLSGSGGTSDGWQLWTDYNINGNLYTRRRWGGTYSSWAKIWGESNDGSGSGLDADLWDGYQFADYLNQAVKTTSTPTFTGLTVSNTISGSVSGNAGTVTNGMYLNSTQTSSARKLFGGSQDVGSLLNATGSLGGLEALNPGGSNAAFMSFHRQGAYASYFGIDTDNNFAVGGWSAGAALASMKVGSFGVGTAASGTAGEIRATNNITAYYSDARLKKFLGKIDNAVHKVNQLNGYYYVENEVAEQYGYKNKQEQVGVSAQEVEAVLPHIVTRAPFDIAKNEDGTEYSKSGEDYKTVRYERLVPLLIEAIKELKAEIEELKKR
jgi:hypothetical protein